MQQIFNEVKIYRLASWLAKHIYFVSKIDRDDRVGLNLKSFFVYNL